MEENLDTDLDTDMAKLKQESASKIEEITAKLSKELESIAENIEQIDKLRMESIDDLENKKKELRESSSSKSICLGPEDIKEKIAMTEKDIELRKDSITKLDETIAKLDEEIARIQAEHDQVLAELMRKRRYLNERLEYFDKLNAKLERLTKFLNIENERFDAALEELNRRRSEILKRTDITEEERDILLEQSTEEIENLKLEHNAHIMESYKHLSDLAFEVPEKERQYKEQFLSVRQIDELREFEEKKFRQKERMTKEERLALLRMGLQITPSGRIITQDGIITLEEARRLGLLNYLYYGLYDEGEEEEEEIEAEYSIKSETKITEKGTLYPSSSRTSTEVSSTLSSSEHHLTSQDVEYLKRVFGKSLTLALAEITAVQPSDPIHYLAHWLIKYRYNQEIDEVKRIELQALMIERERLEAERLHNELTDEARLAMYEVLFRTENYILQREYELRRLAMEADGEEFLGDDDDYDADIRDMIQSIFK